MPLPTPRLRAYKWTIVVQVRCRVAINKHAILCHECGKRTDRVNSYQTQGLALVATVRCVENSANVRMTFAGSLCA